MISPHHLTKDTPNTPKAHHFKHRCCTQTHEANLLTPTRMLQDRSLSPPTSPRPRSQPAAITDRRDATSSLKQHWTARERKPYKLKSIFSRNLTSRFHHRKPTTLPRLDSRIAESPLTSKLTELKMKSKMGAEARAQTRR